MDLTRITPSIDVAKTQAAHVAVVGAGGSATLCCDLARCGVAAFTIFDPDHIEARNVARQGHDSDDLGVAKVEAVAARIRRINPAATVHALPLDVTALAEEDLDEVLGGADLLICATDRFAAQARGNEVALRLGIPALWIGLYAGGRAGELVFWHPGLDACFRCLTARRYAAHARAASDGRSLDPTSDGATIFDIAYVDAQAGMLAVGLLTRGSPNRYGRLIDQLGDRNFLQVTIDPTWTIGGRDIVREQLQIPGACAAYAGFCTIARSDPDRGEPPCPDCVRFRGRQPRSRPEAASRAA
jgi:ThiF family